MRRFVLLVLMLLPVTACGATTPRTREVSPSPGRTDAEDVPPSEPPAAAKPRRSQVPRVPRAASGHYAVVRGGAAPRRGRGAVLRYLVEVERGLPFDGRAFAAEVHRTLNDPRGWARFRRVDHPPVRVRVALSSPSLTDRGCRPLRTGGDLSCWNGTRSIINALRWATGVPQYRGDLDAYRQYVISHEVGHALGHDHTTCPGPGRPAPVMMQQSKSLGRCRPNPWPHPRDGGPER
ncbi:DUF3152 domain-containing protein [Nonomuraea glycinis]|uniref:Lipoprotein n=1 Tax=Nonomuraea glycinis TaxID=2047744 RepID=A0A918A441_9ACTN|nr:DUF3152 domain-containing protein [Nonomuraea glycinis]MCA2177890.1 DUF3152 domain-containing protein [Nonomuraea glycinis]GGP06479.1 lipoprotein [Nonomuraea glycinis]